MMTSFPLVPISSSPSLVPTILFFFCSWVRLERWWMDAPNSRSHNQFHIPQLRDTNCSQICFSLAAADS
ncbi:hypothetical protein SynA1524_02417 [Synechococcus sp. A15-24]|nr:hypothetical protein SynA1524_02417 [Synechococcus sp. A15-24]